MAKLAEISVEELQMALGQVDEAKAAKRLMVALAYKDGVDVETISERYGVPQSTIYYWLDRLETQPLADALRDESRPGRPPKLNENQRELVESWVDGSPAALGYEAETWRAEDLRDQIRESFGVEYSVPHVKRTFLE